MPSGNGRQRMASLAMPVLLSAATLVADAAGALGGFKRSSQHFGKGGCDEYSKATFGPVRAGAIAVTWSAAGGGTCRPAAVLVCDRGR